MGKKKLSILVLTAILILLSQLVCLSTMSAQTPDTIQIRSGDHNIYGLYYSSGMKEPTSTVLLLHGFPGGFGDVLGLGEAISKEGINVFTLTLSGISISEGEYTATSPFEDLNNTLDYFFLPENIRQYNIDTSDFILAGWSLGGALAMAHGAYDPRLARIISIAGFNVNAFLERCNDNPDFKKLMETLFLGYRLRGMINFDPARAISYLEEQEEKLNPVGIADAIATKPMLLFAGTDDREVNLTNHILPYYYAIRAKGGDVNFHVYQTSHRFEGYRQDISKTITEWIGAGQSDGRSK